MDCFLRSRYVLLIFFSYNVLTNGQQQSPCPDVFQYQYDNANNLHGVIRVSSNFNYDSVILLEVQISVGNKVEEFNGNVELMGAKPQVVEDLMQRRPIYYRLDFPYWLKVPPQITKISVNGNQICFGYPIDRNMVPLLTTINLEHRLTLSTPLSVGVSGGNNLIPFEDLEFHGNTGKRQAVYSFSPNSKPSSYSFSFSSPQNNGNNISPESFQNSNNRFQPSSFFRNQVFGNRPGFNFKQNQIPNFRDVFPLNNREDAPRQQNQFPFMNVDQNQNLPDSSNVNNQEDGPTGQNQFPFVNVDQNQNFPDIRNVDNRNEASRPENLFPVFSDPTNVNNQANAPRPQNQIPILNGDQNPSISSPINVNVQEDAPKPQNQIPILTGDQNPSIPEPAMINLPTTNAVRKPFSGECGISVNGNALLINGDHVPKGLHPWLAALFRQDDEGLKFICGSTLVSQRHVVTAAHCIQGRRKRTNPEDLWSVVGRENIQRWSNDGAQIVQAQSTHIHPDFKFNSADADVAVIRLTEEVIFSTLVKPACLWSGDATQKLIFDQAGTVVGWGKDQTGKVSTPEPRQLSIPVVSEETCLRSNPGFRELTSNRTFCAGNRNNSGPCNGDSGSGFLMQKGGRWTLRGVVSTSLRATDGGCDLSNYVVFADAAFFTQWVLSFIN